jgi:O-antigen/teichoic acid export membrane protein
LQVLKKYIKHYSTGKYILFTNLTDRLFSFLYLLLLARYFTADEYGQVITLLALASILSTIFDFGLSVYIQRETAISKSNVSETLSNVLALNFISGLLYIIVGYLFFKILYAELDFYLFLIITIALFFGSLGNVLNRTLSGLNNYKSQWTSIWISRLFILAFGFAGVVYLNFDIISYAAVFFIGLFLHLVIIYWFLISQPVNFKFSSIKTGYLVSIIKISFPLGLAVMFNFLYNKIDVILISQFTDFTETAKYNIGYGLYKASEITFSFFLISGFTKVSSLRRSPRAVRIFFSKYLNIILIVCISTALILYLLSSNIVYILYTSKFSDSILVVKILCAGIIAVGLNNLTGIVLNGIGLFKVVMWATLYGLIINVILNILFIPLYGIIAASINTVITEYVIFILEFYFLRKVLKSNISLPRSH